VRDKEEVIEFILIDNSHWRLRRFMENHYSKPLGFVGRNVCYGVRFEGVWFGAMVAGSAVSHLVGRDAFFGITRESKPERLQRIINNTFCHLEKVDGKYPCRNFTVRVLDKWRQQATADWTVKYGEAPIGFETLVELPRTGEMYRRDGWVEVGQTKGFTCKRTSGDGSDSWSGRRVWNTSELRPKRVFCRISDTSSASSLINQQSSFEFA
jgi:hypothetical protein